MTAPAKPRKADPTEARRIAFLATVPASARGIVQRAFAGKASPRAAVKAYCLVCSGFDRAEVADCLVVLCPLHPYRPFQSLRNPSKSAPVGESCDTTPREGVKA